MGVGADVFNDDPKPVQSSMYSLPIPSSVPDLQVALCRTLSRTTPRAPVSIKYIKPVGNQNYMKFSIIGRFNYMVYTILN